MNTARFPGGRAWPRHAGLAVLLVVAFLIVPLVASAQVAGTQELGAIGGRVLTLGGRSPIEGARVSLEGDSNGVRTDAAGVFHLGSVRPGNRVVWVRALGRD